MTASPAARAARRSLRIAVVGAWLLLLAAASLVLTATPARAAATIELANPNRMAATPLAVDITVDGMRDGRRLQVQIELDGKDVDTLAVGNGTQRLRFPDVYVDGGPHTLSVRSGTTQAEVTFSPLPGWLALVPPLLAIALALIVRDVLVALFVGIFGGALIVQGWQPFAALGSTLDAYVAPAIADGDHAAILLFTTLLGGMVGLITKSGGTQGIVEWLAPYATSSRRGQLATWLMGTLIFFDDYANTLIVGPTMRPITDRLRISREKLAYVVDSTAAPMVCLIPISTWVGYEIGLVADAIERLGLPFDAYTLFIQSIPYRFYPIFALVTVFAVAWSGVDFGPMRRAELRARTTGALLGEGAVPIADYGNPDTQPADGIPKRAWNAFLPIAMVVVTVLAGLWITGRGSVGPMAEGTGTIAHARAVLSSANSFHALMWASLAGVLTAFVVPLAQRLFTLRQGVEAMVAGFKSMLMALVVLTLAWSLSAVCADLSTADYLVGQARDVLSPLWLPALTFVLAAAIAFATGTSWGTMAILQPLVIPICHELVTAMGFPPSHGFYQALLASTVASVLAGAVWGDHCSPISDTTILSSMATGCDHIAHVRTQLPYALSVGVLAIVIGSIPTARGVRPAVALVLGVLIIATVFLAARARRAKQAAAAVDGDANADAA
ncbi:MAG: Na+/H+ antiporter NhaC family protein [Acidobacteriota bacterium]